MNPFAHKKVNLPNYLPLPPTPPSVYKPTFTEGDLQGQDTPDIHIVVNFLTALLHQLPRVSIEALGFLQQQDPKLKAKIQALQDNKKVAGHFLAKGVLLQVCNPVSPRLRLPLPAAVAAKYLDFLHANFRFHHLDLAKLLHLYNQYFVTKNSTGLAKKVISSCRFCALNNRAAYKHLGTASRLVITRPRQLAAADICQFLTGKKGESKSFLLITDVFSQFVRIYLAPPDPTAHDVAQIVMEYLGHQGGLFGIVTDNGSNFQSVLSQSLALLNIRQFRISPLWARSNFTERIHQRVLKILRELFQEYSYSQSMLRTSLTMAQFVINSQKYRSLGWVSPFQITFGSDPTQDICRPSRFVAPKDGFPQYVRRVAAAQQCWWAVANDLRRAADAALLLSLIHI